MRRSKEVVAAVISRVSGAVDDQGYASRPEDNLIRSVRLDQFETDLRSGASKELDGKFITVHSSTALAIHAFAIFKAAAADFTCCGHSGFSKINFAQVCRTGIRGGTHPHLEAWLKNDGEIVAVESKFTEYFEKTQAHYSDAYKRTRFPHAEDCAWSFLEQSKSGDKQTLDVAQLLKHYLGLTRNRSRYKSSSIKLLYLFSERTNARNVDACVHHRNELANLAA